MNAVTEQKHTPGPWSHDADSGEIYFDDGDVYPVIAYVNREGVSAEQAQADGDVLAAAFDMLAALKQARETLVAFMIGQMPTGAIKDHQTIIGIDAALAKVEAR